MRLLIDTHAFLWFIIGDSRISISARLLIEDRANQKLLSLASLWEIAIKHGLGKLAILSGRFDDVIPREITQNGFQVLSINLDQIAITATLPHHHRDPFDRMLIAQALAERIPIVGADAAFDAYGVTRLW